MPDRQLYIEAVSVCFGYSDFLRQAIPYNLPQFDRWIVATSADDEETRELCRQYAIECFLTDDAKDHGDFAKGRVIERALHLTSADGWRLHIDSDIVLPLHFKQLLRMAELQKDTMYGADRIMVKDWNQWQKLQQSGWLDGAQHSKSHFVDFPKGYEVGTRWCSHVVGYVPIGFFQLWHSDQDQWRGIRCRNHPTRHNSAARTDVQHGLLHDRKKRQIIPEVIVAHLESEPAKVGSNWKGRTTRRFGPKTEKQGTDNGCS